MNAEHCLRESDLTLPAYGGGSILDLIRWIRAQVRLDAGATGPLLAAAPETRCRRLVLALFDGLGDRYLAAHGSGTHFETMRSATLTSVFPSTTAAAVTSLMTGLSPAEHGLNGWLCRGHGTVGLFEPLPMLYMPSRKPIRHPLRRQRLFPYRSLYQDLGCPSFVLSPAWLADSGFSRRHGRGAAALGYASLEEVPELLAFALERLGPRGFVYVYLPHFDATAHDYGLASRQLESVFQRTDACCARMEAACRAGGAVLLGTADHGMIDAPEREMLCLGAQPELAELLAMPLWGERRAAFCAIRDGRVDEFRAALERCWPGRLEVLSAGQVLEAGLLGPGVAHRDLRLRLGDLLLLPRGQGSLVEAESPADVHPMRAVHGGLSAEEMEVPLLVGGAI